MPKSRKPLRICILGKYPPIEGGVSAQTYWLARGLALRGHAIHIVTNADEVEDQFRMQLDSHDARMLQPQFDNGGSVRVHHVESFNPSSMFHIPVANPFVTRLASLAIDVVRRYDCEVILAYYLEPYGMAGWFAAQRSGRPLLLKHAGSDLERLAKVTDLGLAYKEILSDASAVVTSPRLMRRFAGMGVLPSRIVKNPPYQHDSDFFSPNGPALDVDALAISDGAGTPVKPLPPSAAAPMIGVYGKVGAVKGTFDLISALERVAAEERHFRLAALVGSEYGARMRTNLAESTIADRTLILPFLANWRIPEFIRACTAVCFLERDFPIALHGSMIPGEVLACGTCLIVSKEIADKQGNAEQLENGVRLIVVSDPRDTDELAHALRRVIDDPGWARRVGIAGATAVAQTGEHERFIVSWEAILERYARHADGPAGEGSSDNSEERHLALEAAVPALLSYAEKLLPTVVARFLDNGSDAGLPGCALDFCAMLAKDLPAAVAVEHRPVLIDAIRYTLARLRAGFDVAGAAPHFAVVDQLRDREVSFSTAAQLYPVRSNLAIVEEFDYDVSAVFSPERPAEPTGGEPLDWAEARHCFVLFQRTANLAACELDLSPAIVALLEICDGRHTTAQVVDEIAAVVGNGQDDRERVMDALRRLHALGVVVFGQIDPAWGWSKGARSDIAALPPLRGSARISDPSGAR
jgi:glycosyltransferase involved in cell wall biosynthesis